MNFQLRSNGRGGWLRFDRCEALHRFCTRSNLKPIDEEDVQVKASQPRAQAIRQTPEIQK